MLFCSFGCEPENGLTGEEGINELEEEGRKRPSPGKVVLHDCPGDGSWIGGEKEEVIVEHVSITAHVRSCRHTRPKAEGVRINRLGLGGRVGEGERERGRGRTGILEDIIRFIHTHRHTDLVRERERERGRGRGREREERKRERERERERRLMKSHRRDLGRESSILVDRACVHVVHLL